MTPEPGFVPIKPVMRTIYWGALLLIALVQFGFGAFWSTSMIGPTDRTEAYDSLATSLLKGDVTVEAGAVNWEGTTVNGRTVMYFGAFPALPRMVLNEVLPEFRGLWGRLLNSVAGVLSMLAFSVLVRRGWRESDPGSDKLTLYIQLLLVMGFAFGTPAVLLVSCGHIYHEAISWGLAWSLWAVVVALRIAESDNIRTADLFLLSFFSAFALLSRITFGVPVLFLLSACVIASAASQLRARQFVGVGATVASLTPAALGVAFQGWYNFQRYGSILDFQDYQHFYVKPDAFGGVFNLARIPSALSNYFWFGAENFISSPPYVVMRLAQYANPANFWDWREHTLGLILGSPWLIFLSIVGAFSCVRTKSSPLKFLIGIGLLGQSVLICCYYFDTQRFASEFLPLFAFTTYCALPWVRRSGRRPLVSFGLTILIAWSVTVSSASTLHWTMLVNASVPAEYKASIRRLFSPRPQLPPRDGEKVFLNDLEMKNEYYKHVPLRKNQNVSGEPLSIGGWPYAHGIGAHAEAYFECDVPEGAQSFEAILAISDMVLQYTEPSVEVQVLGDSNETLFKSSKITVANPWEIIHLEVNGQKRLRFSIGSAGDGINYDHINLVEAGFIRPKGQSESIP